MEMTELQILWANWIVARRKPASYAADVAWNALADYYYNEPSKIK